MKSKVLCFCIYLLLFTAGPVLGQIEFGGLADFELRKGGADSDATVNQTPNGKWLVYVPSTRLFVNGAISDEWSVNGALQYDYYDGSRSELFFSSINLQWRPSDAFGVTAGRFVTPYGRFDELLLSSENPFVHMPLTHAWNLQIDREKGYVFSETSYDDVAGLSMVYRRLYSQGIMISGQTGGETFSYHLASTLTSVSSYADVGHQNTPALVGRVEVKPVIWNKIGLSFSRGPYMVEHSYTDVLSDKQRADYLQTIGTAYMEFSYHYYQLLLQYSYSRWDSPWITSEGVIRDRSMYTDVAHYMAKLKVRFPFLVGGYGAVRYEIYDPKPISSPQKPHDWQPTSDKQRWEFVLGYQLERNLLVKASYLLSRNDQVAHHASPELKDDVFAIQISAGF